jgi:hypothetical protein
MLVDPGGGSAAFQGIGNAVSGIVEAANAGFAISENGGQPLLNAIEDLATEVASALGKSSVLGSHLPLGTTPNANVYKPFLASVATDPVQGAVPALRKLHDDLTSARAAIQKAMDNYQNADQESASNVQSSGTWT